MLNQDHNVWCSSSVTQETFKGQKWRLGLFFLPSSPQTGTSQGSTSWGWNWQDTHIHLPGFLWSPGAWSVLLFGKSSVNLHAVLEKGSSNRMHRFLCPNWQLLHLWWCGGVQKHFCCCLAILSFALPLKKGKGKNSASTDSPQGQLDSVEMAETFLPVELQLAPLQLFPVPR